MNIDPFFTKHKIFENLTFLKLLKIQKKIFIIIPRFVFSTVLFKISILFYFFIMKSYKFYFKPKKKHKTFKHLFTT